MPVADTSIHALDRHRKNGQLGEQHRQVLSWLQQHRGGWTRSEISQETGIRLSSVTARVNELIDAGKLVDGPRRRCTVTGVSAKAVTVKKDAVPVQLPLLEMA